MTLSTDPYIIEGELNKEKLFTTYKGIRLTDKRDVLIKTFNSQQPSLEEIDLLKNEYEITKELQIPQILVPIELERYKNAYRLILENFSGKALSDLIEKNTFDQTTLLELAIKITQAIGAIHEHKIIHHDIQPKHIWVDLEKMELKITGFEIATLTSSEAQFSPQRINFKGDLSYISPEQTGRMNRQTDYRTDYYSLGVTLYRLFTGKLPFNMQDPFEMIHAHIAKAPLAPHLENPEVPEALSAIIMKLMAKTVEERYNSAYGIVQDLHTCLHELKTKGYADPFLLGTKDILHSLNISKRVIGRENEIQTLLKAFDKSIKNGPYLVFIKGYAGVGKSSIVSEIRDPVKQSGGYFLKGKCDHYKSNIPYYPLLDAFRDLIQQILMENDQIISNWRERLNLSLGNNVQFLTDLIPELKLIMGKSPLPMPSEGSEGRNRLQLFLERFIVTLASTSTPMAIYLDDLQWIDTASVKLLEIIMDLKCNGLFLICSFRDNELSFHHPFAKLVERLLQKKERVETIAVSPLSDNQVLDIISETLHTPPAKCVELSQIVTKKTQGNPYFVIQILNYLFEEKLLTFDTVNGSWSWDMSKLYAVSISDNVIDLLIQKLQKCSASTQQILQAAACTGNTFNIELLSSVTGLSYRDVIGKLQQAVKDGFIIPTNSGRKILSEISDEAIDYLNPSLLLQPLRFSHDRVQQAAYATLTEEERSKIHLKVARILSQKLGNFVLQEQVFEVVYHYNQAKEILTKDVDRMRCIELNCAAAKKAIQSIAFAQAVVYLNIGLSLLPEDKWVNHYPLTLEMYMLLAESTFMVGEFDQASEIFDQIQKIAKTEDEKLDILILKIKLNVYALRYDKAIEYGRIALKMVGVHFPNKFKSFYALKELLLAKARLSFTHFRSLPDMSDPKILKAVHILYLLGPASYFIERDLSLYILSKSLNLNLKYGLSPDAPFAFVSFGVILSSVFKDYGKAYDLGKAALELIPRFPNSKCITSTRYIFSSFLQPYKEHIKSCISDLTITFEEGILYGDWVFALFSLGTMISDKFFSGESIEDIYKTVLKYEDFVSKVKSHNIETIFECWLHTMTPLRNQNPDPWTDPNNPFLDAAPIPENQDSKHLMTNYFDLTFKMQLAYLFGHYDKALKYATESDSYATYTRRHIVTVENKFYRALALAATITSKDKKQLQMLDSFMQKLKSLADSCPANFLQKYLLIKAEKARIEGNKEEAIESYDAAVESARENGFVQNDALASELFARYYLSIKKETIAKQYLLKAAYGYYRWGAKAKVAQLQQAYPALLPVNTFPELQQSQPLPSSEIDLALLFKTSQLIAKEIELDKLLEQTVRQMIQITDASTGYILIDKKGEWIVGSGAGSPAAEHKQAKPLKELEAELPLSLIHYVIKTRENIVLENIHEEELFRNDPYFLRSSIQGALCFPLIHKAKLTGILYLEKQSLNLRTLPEKIELTRILSGQIATAIENAILYNNISLLFSEVKVSNETMEQNIQNLERTINSRTQELSKKNQELESTLKQIKEIQKRLIEQEKLVSMGSITKSVAHDIYQPMENIHTLAKETMGLINTLHPSPESRALVNTLETNIGKVIEHTTRADEIVATLTLNSQEAVLEKEEVDINKLIRNYADLVYSSYYRKDLTFSLTLETSYDSTIGKLLAYPSDLGRVFYNIIDNACYSIDQKKRHSAVPYSPIVSISTSNLLDRIIVRIWDNGEGVPDQIMDKLFTPYLSTKSKTTNAGMGLSISHDIIVNQHGGKIEVNTKLGEFTEVLITLPKE